MANELRGQRSPLVIGLLNGFMLGCGPLQAMYVMAAGTGSALEGATMLFFFGLGTLIPLMSFGLFASSIPRRILHQLVLASAILVIAMGLMMADRGLKLTGSGYDFNSLTSRSQQFQSVNGAAIGISDRSANNYLESAESSTTIR